MHYAHTLVHDNVHSISRSIHGEIFICVVAVTDFVKSAYPTKIFIRPQFLILNFYVVLSIK